MKEKTDKQNAQNSKIAKAIPSCLAAAFSLIFVFCNLICSPFVNGLPPRYNGMYSGEGDYEGAYSPKGANVKNLDGRVSECLKSFPPSYYYYFDNNRLFGGNYNFHSTIYAIFPEDNRIIVDFGAYAESDFVPIIKTVGGNAVNVAGSKPENPYTDEYYMILKPESGKSINEGNLTCDTFVRVPVREAFEAGNNINSEGLKILNEHWKEPQSNIFDLLNK